MLRFAVEQTERRLASASPALAILTLTQISGRRNVSQLFPVYKTTNFNVLLRKISFSSKTYFAKIVQLLQLVFVTTSPFAEVILFYIGQEFSFDYHVSIFN